MSVPHRHMCHFCYAVHGTWGADILPKGWRRLSPERVVCKRCVRAAAVRALLARPTTG